MASNLLAAAEDYLKRGLSLIPFKRDKSGACIKWTEYQKTRPSMEDAKKWFTSRFKNEFLAIVTGKISNLLVVDLDSEAAYQRVQEFIPDYVSTPTVKSPHGYHLYFQHKDGLINRANYGDDTDVRTDGGCIIAPPSVNGDGLEYRWLPGLSIMDIEPAIIPDNLYYLLLQYISSSNYINNASAMPEKTPNEVTNVTSITNHNITFNEGGRDDTLFHLIWYLRKGGMSRQEIEIYAKFVASHCNPPFPPEEVDLKIQSAFERKKRSENGLTAAIRDYLSVTKGNFSVTNLNKALQVITSQDQASVRAILHRMAKKGELIERDPKLDGVFRVIDNDCKPLDWINAECEYRDLWLPLGLGHICGVQPGNVLVFAGAKDSGKTAFLMNIAKENRHQYKVHYFNSEMGVKEWKMRVGKFDDITMEQFNRGVFLYERSANFADVVKQGEGNLKIIDFLEVPDEVWRVGSMIQKIHAKLDGSICVIALQKKIGQDLGRGAEFSMEKARLYVSLDYQRAKIVSCKNFKENDIIAGNPRGYTTQYKLVNGCKIIKSQQGWTSPTEKEKL